MSTTDGATVRTRLMGSNDNRVARQQLEEVWQRLEPILGEAKAIQEDVTRSPSLSTEPWVVAHVRWLTVFGREIEAVQTVHDSLAAGARLAPREIESAREAAEQLLEIIEKARSLVPQPA